MKKLAAKPIYDRILNFTPLVLTALMPLFFLPITTEFFEFNKQVLLIMGTILLMVAWALKIVVGKQVEISKSIIDIPLLAFLGVTLLATIFSQSKADSIYGSTGRWFPSLLGCITLTLFYYLVSSGVDSIKNIKSIVNTFIIATTVNTFITILSYFGIYLGKAAFFQIPNFTLTGSITTSIAIAAISAVIGTSLMVYNSQNIRTKAMYLVATLLNIVLIGLINVWFGWAMLLIGFVVMGVIIKPEALSQCKPGLTVVLLIALLFGTVKNIPQTKGFLTNSSYPIEIVLPLKASWSIVTSILSNDPLLATGPSTFYLDFTRYRPLSLNTTAIWNIRFDKPFNEVLNIIGELGLIGLFVSIYLGTRIWTLIKKSSKATNENYIIKVLGIAVATTATVFLFTYATTLNTYVMVLLVALLVRGLNLESGFERISRSTLLQLAKVNKVISVTGLEIETVKHSPIKIIIVLPLLLLAAYMGYMTTRNYLSEFYTRQSMAAAQNNAWDRVYKLQEAAIKASPIKDSLYTRHAQTILILANSIAAKENLTEEDKTLIQNLIAQSINVSKIASETINPLNVRNWETRALIYKNIAQAAQNATEWAIASYNIAIQLDPTNPRLRLDLGGMYYAKGDFLSAASQFRQAISLKGDYANAYYNFGQSLYQLNDLENAKAALETTKTLIPAGSEDATLVSQEIEILTQKLNTAGAAAQKPTVEQIQAKEDAKVQTQEPLNKVGEATPTIGGDIKENTLVETPTKQ